jgi:ribosomal protein S18 acetylase RimI-like enzyme
MNKIYLEVKVDNITAIYFYVKHGYRIKERIPSFYINGEDAYVMIKDI